MSDEERNTVLVVEDDPRIRQLIVAELSPHYSVIEAENGLTGLVRATGRPRPDLIITDVEMPKLDGVAMVKRIRTDSRLATIPIIFLTSRDGTRDVVSGIQAGARFYLTKPFEGPELLEKVRGTLRA